MLQAPMFDGLSLDPFTLFDDGWCPAEVGVGGRHVVQALVVTLVVVVLDECLDLGFEVAGQEVVLQQDAVFEGLVPAFDLALGLRVQRGTANMAHLPGLDVFRQFARDVAGAIVRPYMRRRAARDEQLGQGGEHVIAPELARHRKRQELPACLGVTEQTYYRWRKEYGGLKTDQARRMKDLEKENARLRRAISDLTLDKLILQEVARGNF